MKTVDMKTRIHWFLWKRIGYLLLFVSVIFVINQLQISTVLNRQEVGKLIVGSLRDTHRVIVGKKTSKWSQPQHSKLVRDKNGRTVSLRGTRDQDIAKYLPNANGKFMCFPTREEIDFVKINDDYCDCPDGSDEPGTNACNNGIFYCEMNSRKSAAKIPSYKVNDGFCDCCDGSDEWAEALVLYQVKESGSVTFHGIKCPNKC